MTLDEICEMDAATLEAMSDAQLLEHFKQYLNVTRPELAAKTRTTQPAQTMVYITPAKRKALEAAKDAGIDLSFMYQKGRKR